MMVLGDMPMELEYERPFEGSMTETSERYALDSFLSCAVPEV